MKLLRAFFAPLGLVLLCSFLPGCKTLHVNAGVLMTLVELKVQPDDTAVLQINMHNENLTPFAVREAKHKVTINGVYYGVALSTKPVGLPEVGDGRQEAVLKLANSAAAAQLQAALVAGSVTYNLDSELRTDAGDYELILRSEANGQLGAR